MFKILCITICHKSRLAFHIYFFNFTNRLLFKFVRDLPLLLISEVV